MEETDTWYMNPAYHQYWKQYQYMKNWYESNKEEFWHIYSPLSSTKETGCGRCCHNRRDQYFSYSQHAHVSKQNNHKKNRTHQRNNSLSKIHRSRREKTKSTDGDDDEIEMEITEEMIAFLEQSEKHRQELKAERDEKKKSQSEKKTVSDDDKIENQDDPSDALFPPRLRPGVQRTAEMKFLYGKNAAMIHGMETAMQLTYDRNCDLLQPKLWPNIPLKM